MEQNGTTKIKHCLSCKKCDYECSDITDFNIHLNTTEHKKTRESRKSRESNKILCCNKCNYNCCSHSEFNRHINTIKHKNQFKTTRNINEYSCECGKTYVVKSGLWKHKKVCSLISNYIVVQENPEEKPSMVDSMMEIISQNKELMNLLVVQNQEHKQETRALIEQNKELTKTVQEMVPKIGNNNNNTTNNNQFNLQVFLNEDCKDAINFSDFIAQIQVSFEDIENQAESGYVKGISKLFIENLKELGTHKRPIHCTDKKRKTLYIKENNEWDKEGSQDILLKGIQEVTRSTMKTLINEKVIQAEEFADMESDFSKKCLVIQRNLIPTPPRETAFSKVMENITKNSGIVE